jgi:hypothetical protein
MRPLLLVSIFLVGLPIAPLSAQETSGSAGGGYGYTSVNYDSSSNTVTIYAETVVDDDTYYSPAVDTAVNDNEGYLFTSGSSTSPCPGGTAASEGSDTDISSVTCTINNANRNDIYAANTSHTAVTYVTDYEEGINDSRNYDIDGYNSFAPLNMSAPFGDYYDPPFVLQHTSSKRLPLGKTSASDSTGARSACGDVRDQIIAEYLSKTRPTTFTMITCSDFAWINTYTNPGGFTFLQLAPTQSTGYGQFAVLQKYMALNLRNVFNSLGGGPTINSGYRNPAKEASVGTYYPNSRHMAGDAVDLATGNSQNTYTQQRNAGIQYSGCVEPVDLVHGPQTNYNHTHIDWRSQATPNGAVHFAGPSSCPPKWH